MIIRKREETKPVKVDAEARADQEHKTRAGRDTEWEADEATAATPTATGDTPKNERGHYHERNHKDKQTCRTA